MTKAYTNGEITIKWESTVCHSVVCVKALPTVYDPNRVTFDNH